MNIQEFIERFNKYDPEIKIAGIKEYMDLETLEKKAFGMYVNEKFGATITPTRDGAVYVSTTEDSLDVILEHIKAVIYTFVDIDKANDIVQSFTFGKEKSEQGEKIDDDEFLYILREIGENIMFTMSSKDGREVLCLYR